MAPLKQQEGCLSGIGFAGFPRLQRRGPIEAGMSEEMAVRQHAFPRLQRRGPIEARHTDVHPTAFAEFPRLQRRGPIEAWRW